MHFLSPAVYWDCSSYHPHWPTNHQTLGWFSILQLVFNWNTIPTFKNLFSLKDFVALFSNFFIAFLFVFYWLFLPITSFFDATMEHILIPLLMSHWIYSILFTDLQINPALPRVVFSKSSKPVVCIPYSA